MQEEFLLEKSSPALANSITGMPIWQYLAQSVHFMQ